MFAARQASYACAGHTPLTVSDSWAVARRDWTPNLMVGWLRGRSHTWFRLESWDGPL